MNLTTSIEQTLAKAEAGTLEAGVFFQDLSTAHPEIFTFLFDEDTRLLSEQEHDYMLFLAMIEIHVLREQGTDLDAFDIEALDDMAEHNWGLIEHTSIENITETLSRHPGFDLYMFLEEGCTPITEHEVLTEAAAELVYVKCKSLIDTGYLSA